MTPEEEAKKKKQQGMGLSSIAPGAVVADAVESGFDGAGSEVAAEATANASSLTNPAAPGYMSGYNLAPSIGPTQLAADEAELAASQGGPGMGGIMAGAYTGYQQAKGAQAALKGENMSLTQQAALALPTFGASFLYNPLKKAFGFGGQSTHQEEKLRQQLAEQGINVNNAGVKEWELNEKFKQSRNEADLTGKDIINSAKLYQLQGYKDASEQKRLAIADEALKQNLVREHHGTMDFGTNAAFEEFVKNQLAAKESSGNQTDRRVQSENKKERKRAQVDQVLSLNAQPTQAPRYDINLSDIYKNPYL